MKLCFDANDYLHQATGIEKGTGFVVYPKAHMKDGFPSELDLILDEYAEEPDTCDTVFGYVPIAIVNELISKHGGIIIED